jgi:hypothetical protein
MGSKSRNILVAGTALLAASLFIFYKTDIPCKLLKYNCDEVPNPNPNPPTDDCCIIVSYCKPASDKAVKELNSKMEALGFTLKKSCDCLPTIQLWENKNGGAAKLIDGGPPVIKADTIGSIGFSLNPQIYPGSLLSLLAKKAVINPAPTSDNDVVIAIVDSGVDPTNDDLKTYLFKNQPNSLFCDNNQRREGTFGMDVTYKEEGIAEPLDKNGHGTFVNGILTGSADPTVGEYRENHNIHLSLLNAKFTEGKVQSGDLFDAACAMSYAIRKGCQVMNISWCIKSQTPPEVFCPIMKLAKQYDVLIVAGSGNENKDIDDPKNEKSWPASFSTYNQYDVICVGGWDMKANNRYVMSNTGSKTVNVYAPAIYNQSIGLGNTLVESAGTSFATPYVTRQAAILRGMHPKKAKNGDGGWTASDVKNYIIKDVQLREGYPVHKYTYPRSQ